MSFILRSAGVRTQPKRRTSASHGEHPTPHSSYPPPQKKAVTQLVGWRFGRVSSPELVTYCFSTHTSLSHNQRYATPMLARTHYTRVNPTASFFTSKWTRGWCPLADRHTITEHQNNCNRHRHSLPVFIIHLENGQGPHYMRELSACMCAAFGVYHSLR